MNNSYIFFIARLYSESFKLVEREFQM